MKSERLMENIIKRADEIQEMPVILFQKVSFLLLKKILDLKLHFIEYNLDIKFEQHLVDCSSILFHRNCMFPEFLYLFVNTFIFLECHILFSVSFIRFPRELKF